MTYNLQKLYNVIIMSWSILPRSATSACLLHKASKSFSESQFQKIIRQTLRQKHVWTRRSTSSIAYDVPKRDPPKTFEQDDEAQSYSFQQVASPDYEEKFEDMKYTKFKGLETDFPCLTKK